MTRPLVSRTAFALLPIVTLSAVALPSVAGSMVSFFAITRNVPLILPATFEEVPGGQAIASAFAAVLVSVALARISWAPVALVALVSFSLAFVLSVLPTVAVSSVATLLVSASLLVASFLALRAYGASVRRLRDGAPWFMAGVLASVVAAMAVTLSAASSFSGMPLDITGTAASPAVCLHDGSSAWDPRSYPSVRRSRIDVLANLAESEANELGIDVEIRLAVLPHGDKAAVYGDETILLSVGIASDRAPYESAFQVSRSVFEIAEVKFLSGDDVTLPSRSRGAWMTMRWNDDTSAAHDDAVYYAQSVVDSAKAIAMR